MRENAAARAGQPATQVAPISKGRRWAGGILSALPQWALVLDGVAELAKPAFVVEGTVQLGYPERSLLPRDHPPGVPLCM
jgi:hypothetical protein